MFCTASNIRIPEPFLSKEQSINSFLWDSLRKLQVGPCKQVKRYVDGDYSSLISMLSVVLQSTWELEIEYSYQTHSFNILKMSIRIAQRQGDTEFQDLYTTSSDMKRNTGFMAIIGRRRLKMHSCHRQVFDKSSGNDM